MKKLSIYKNTSGTTFSGPLYKRIVSFILLLPLLFAGLSCDEKPAIENLGSDQVIPDQVFLHPKIIVTENSLTTAIIKARKIRVFEEKRYTSLEDSIEIRFFNKEGKHTSTLTADAGEVWGLYQVVDTLKVHGNVVVVSIEKNIRLKTEDLRWIKTARRVLSDSLVTIESEDGYERGTGFTALDDLSEYEFRNQVSGEFKSEDIKLFEDEKAKKNEP